MAELDVDDIQRRMDASIASLHNEFMGLRAGRASTGMLEPIMVDVRIENANKSSWKYFSARAKIAHSVSLGCCNGPMVEKAIRESDLGLNPATEGNLIRVPIPDLSEERRKDMVRVAGRYAEGCRVAIRNIRRDSIEKIRKAEKDGMISEDDRHTQENHVQKLTDEFVKKVDDALS